MKTLRFAALLVAGLVPASAQTSYTITDLGTLPGLAHSYAAALNATGQITGSALAANGEAARAFLYSAGKLTDLGTLPGGTVSFGYGLNAAGQVVGGAVTAAREGRAFLHAGGVMTALGTLGGDYSWASAINAAGQIAGESTLTIGGNFHAFLYSGGRMTDLGTLGGAYSSAKAINDSGQIAGQSETGAAFNPLHAFLYTGGRMTDLGTLGGNGSWANALNHAAHVVGASYLSSTGSPVPLYDQHAFLHANGRMTDLGTLEPYGSSEANAINASGQIVGEVFHLYESNAPDSTGQRAFLYAGGRMTDLNRLLTGGRGWTLLQATAINDAGLIAGFGLTPAGERHAFLLTPSSLPPDPVWPTILRAPVSQHVAPGVPVTFTVAAIGGDLGYQWKKNGVALPGATDATYTIASATPATMGFYSVVVKNPAGAPESEIAILTVAVGNPGRLVNLSTRGFVPDGGDLTVGFVIRDGSTKSLLVRAVGPTLGAFGLTGALADPRLELIPSNAGPATQSNDDWAGGPALAGAFADAGAFALPAGSKDAALLATLAPASFTARITTGLTGSGGLALAEVYDRDGGGAGGRLMNLSTRGFVGTGPHALVPGFVIGGVAAKSLLIRAVGPGLAPFGVTGWLTDPQLAVVPLGQSFTVARNDTWDVAAATVFAQVGAFALPFGSTDAALVVRLPPGGYTVTVSGADQTTGTALVEIYDLDP